MSLLPRRLPSPRRAALVLAALLVPVTVLPALAGLIVCPGPDGPTTSWSADAKCPRQAQPVAAQIASDEAPQACVTVPDAEPMVAPEAPLVPVTSAALIAPAIEVPAPAIVPAEAHAPERGPPLALGVLRTVVLRI